MPLMDFQRKSIFLKRSLNARFNTMQILIVVLCSLIITTPPIQSDWSQLLCQHHNNLIDADYVTRVPIHKVMYQDGYKEY
jgi:hypothetical protein